jgi:DNA-binding NarL/FixJ family response regulator
MKPVRILLVDDHTLVRAGLRALLEGVEGVKVIAEAGDGAAALELVRRDAPDIVVADIEMKVLDGLELAARLKEEFPSVRVAILSMHSSEEYVQQALRAGAAAYLLKDAAPLELEAALHALMRGETYLSPRVTKQVVSGYVQATAPAADVLTARQREILKLIAEGHSAKEIAYQLAVSVKTVEAHRAQIMERLQIGDIPGLVKYAIRNGLIKLD